jgi:hypothetical protein
MGALAAGVLAAGFQVNGAHGVLILLAFLCELVAAIVAYFVLPLHRVCVSLLALGLCLFFLAQLVSG